MIVCTFEKDFCHWEHLPEDDVSQYAWNRETSTLIEGLGIPGPPSDHLGNKETYYAFSGNKLPAGTPQDSTADLISPYLIGQEHNVECVMFQVYFGVSFHNSIDIYENSQMCITIILHQNEGQGDMLRVLQRIKDRDDPILLWELDESFVGEEPKWNRGQFEIRAEDTPGFEYRVSGN